MREKWLKAIGRESVGKHSRVCSDHFVSSSFHPKNGYNNIKTKLIKGAVPTIFNADTQDAVMCDSDLISDVKVERIDNLSEIDVPIGLQELELDYVMDNNDILYDMELQSINNLPKSIISDHSYTIMSNLYNSKLDSIKKADNCDSLTENNSANSKK